MRILICLLFSIVAVDFAAAGCDINLKIKNETGLEVRIGPGKDFKVKTRGIPEVRAWKKGWTANDWIFSGTHYDTSFKEDLLRNNFDKAYWHVPIGESVLDIYEATRGCNVNRRYRFKFTCLGYDESRATARAPKGVGIGYPTKARYFPGPNGWTKNTNITIALKNCGPPLPGQ